MRPTFAGHYQSSSSSSNSNSEQHKPNMPHISSSVSQGAKYFESSRKGEVNELKQLLKNTLNDQDDKKRREVVKKVIAYMTLGIDVSRLFNEMCLSSYTNDIIEKKMIYLYLTNYAESNPESAVMAINTFLKDCNHKDGKIRGLALRSLCSLRFAGSFEYLMPAIQEALKDLDPYVRKTAILGLVKVYYMQPELIKKDNDIIDTLYKMIRDQDTLVVQNAIEALKEILQDEGGIAISSKMIIYLLNKIKDFNEWGQCQVLQLCSLYTPKSEQEAFDIMNLLDDRLKHSCITIVLSTIKIFMSFTKNNVKIYNQVFLRVKTPMITLVSSSEIQGSFEITYTVLCHILFIVSRGGSEYFTKEFKQFYLKADEPTYIKFNKLQILSYLANENNIGDMINELGEYVTDVDQELAKQSIITLSTIALRVSEMATPIVKQLSTFINMQKEHITNITLVGFSQILRKHPEQFKELSEVLQSSVDQVTEPESKSALLWILGEFGEKIEESPYILENFLNSDENQEILQVKHILLTTSIKLFLKRPTEMQQILGQVFKQIFSNQTEDIDLRDRAAFYYRAMQNDIEEFKALMFTKMESIDKYTEEEEEAKEKDSLNFNTLSIIFNKSQEKYIKPFSYFSILRNKEMAAEIKKEEAKQENEETNNPEEAIEQQDQSNKQQNQQQQQIEEGDLIGNQTPNQVQSSDQQQQQQQQAQDLLDGDINFGAPSIKNIEIDDLVLNFEMDQVQFQNSWGNLNEGATITRMMNSSQAITESTMEELLKYYRIYSIASGEQDNQIKFYLYSKHATQNACIYIDLEINLNQKTLSLITKSENEELAVFFSKYIEDFLKVNAIIN